jgi:ribonuclease BN (tRNA processing enzyme)
LKVEVLGCSGGELPRHRATCFLVDGKLAIDAGALTQSLPLERLLEVDDIVLTHGHLDHVKDVPLLADLLVGRRHRPVRVHASPACAETLHDNVFNGALWPDFTRIPDTRRPVLEIRPFDLDRPFKVGPYTIRPVPVAHTVESVGLVISDRRASFAVSGDTGPTTRFWERVNAERRLRALLVELSYPSTHQELADASGHLTPRTLAGELRKLERDGFPVLLYHLKPAHAAAVRRELASLALPHVRVLRRGETLKL